MNQKCKKVTDYWLAYYVSENGLCSLCGNTGTLDTSKTAISPAGHRSGRKNFCICPNGQAERKASLPNVEGEPTARTYARKHE